MNTIIPSDSDLAAQQAEMLPVPRSKLVEVIELLNEAQSLRNSNRYEARDLERRARVHLERLLDGTE